MYFVPFVVKKSYHTTHRPRLSPDLVAKNIAKLTKERRRRAGKKIQEEWEAQNSSREGAKSRRKEE